MRRPVPLVSLLAAAAALAAHASPPLRDLLVYEREAVLHGEGWRIFTAPLVHFSASHLLWNLAVACGAGALAERAVGRHQFLLSWVLAAGSTGIFLLLFEPELSRYGGLSGLATGAVTALSLRRSLRATARAERAAWVSVLGLVIAKILWEWASGLALFAQPSGVGFRVLPEAHALGLLSAACIELGRRVRGRGSARAVARRRSPIRLVLEACRPASGAPD